MQRSKFKPAIGRLVLTVLPGLPPPFLLRKSSFIPPSKSTANSDTVSQRSICRELVVVRPCALDFPLALPLLLPAPSAFYAVSHVQIQNRERPRARGFGAIRFPDDERFVTHTQLSPITKNTPLPAACTYVCCHLHALSAGVSQDGAIIQGTRPPF